MKVRNLILSALIATLTASGIAPVAFASDAHPDIHTYYGAHEDASQVDVEVHENGVNFELHGTSQVTIEAICEDVVPIVRTIPLLPPNVGFDGDTESGVGGACFAYTTVYGDDTGDTVTIYVSEGISTEPVAWLACVDMNGDGLCSSVTGGDILNFCSTGTARQGSVASGGGPCTIFADPSAVVPAVQVLMLGSLDIENDQVNHNSAIRGTVRLL